MGAESPKYFRSRILPRLVLLLTSVLLSLGLLEVGLRLFLPQVMLTPRFDFTLENGLINFSDVVMRHIQPGEFDFRYTVNRDRYRGELVSFDSPSKKIVVLGDSFSFGIGVNDSETYSFQLEQLFSTEYEVINLANSGWGLTSEIHRFLSYGRHFRPQLVILQFSRNDPEENLRYPLVEWDANQGSFVVRKMQSTFIGSFQDLFKATGIVYTLLTGYSQVYNFSRGPVRDLLGHLDYVLNLGRESDENESSDVDDSNSGQSDLEERYVELFEPFVEYLNRGSVRLLMISVQGQLRPFPQIRRSIENLETQGQLTYLGLEEWLGASRGLKESQEYRSPEGHWSAKAHQVIAEVLFQSIEGSSMPEQ